MITQAEAARRLGVKRPYITKLKKQVPIPPYFLDDGIDENHPEFILLEEKMSNDISQKMNNEQVSIGKKKSFEDDDENDYDGYVSEDLKQRAMVARLNEAIFKAEIKEQISFQEKVKTAELKKELAPTSLIKHFFSFSENLIQRLYRRPHEIAPQLEALFIANEQKKAVDMMRRELEAIVKQCQKELIAEIESEGYKAKEK